LSGNISEDKKTDISYRDRDYFKLWLGNLDTGLQVEGKTLKYRNSFLERSYKDLQTGEIKN